MAFFSLCTFKRKFLFLTLITNSILWQLAIVQQAVRWRADLGFIQVKCCGLGLNVVGVCMFPPGSKINLTPWSAGLSVGHVHHGDGHTADRPGKLTAFLFLCLYPLCVHSSWHFHIPVFLPLNPSFCDHWLLVALVVFSQNYHQTVKRSCSGMRISFNMLSKTATLRSAHCC